MQYGQQSALREKSEKQLYCMTKEYFLLKSEYSSRVTSLEEQKDSLSSENVRLQQSMERLGQEYLGDRKALEQKQSV